MIYKITFTHIEDGVFLYEETFKVSAAIAEKISKMLITSGESQGLVINDSDGFPIKG